MIDMPTHSSEFQNLTPQTRNFLQKICFKKAASIDMTQYGFITDSKIQPLSLLLKPLQAQLVKMIENKKKESKMKKEKVGRFAGQFMPSENDTASPESSNNYQDNANSKSLVMKAHRHIKTNNNDKKKKNNEKTGEVKKEQLSNNQYQFACNVRHATTKTLSPTNYPKVNKRSGATTVPVMVVMHKRKRWPRSRMYNGVPESLAKVKRKVKFENTNSPRDSSSAARSRMSSMLKMSPNRKVLEQTNNGLVANKNQKLTGVAARMILQKHQELELKINPNFSRNNQYVVQEKATSLIFNAPLFKDSAKSSQRNIRRPKYARHVFQGQAIKVINVPARKLDKGTMIPSLTPLKSVKRSTFAQLFAMKPPEVPYRPDLSLATRTTSDRFSSPVYYQSPTAYHTAKLQREKRRNSEDFNIPFPFRTVL